MISTINELMNSQTASLSILFSIIIFFLTLVIFFLLSKVKWTKYSFLPSFFDQEKLSFATLITLIFFYLFFPLEHLVLQTLIEKTLIIIIIITTMWFFIRLVSVLKEIVYSNFPVDKKDNLHERKVRTQFQYIQLLLILIIIIAGISSILWQFDHLRGIGTGLLASAGIFGIVIAFAAQSTLGNLIAGFQIAFAQPFRIDDVVIVEGEWGRIEQITLTFVVVRIWDQRRLVLPISYFINHPFQNWTRKTSDIIGTVFLHLDYKIPVEKVRKELHNIVKTTDLWDGEVVVLQVTDTTEKTITLRALVSAKDASNAWSLRCYVREKLISFLQKNYPDSLPKIRIEKPKS